MSSLEVGSAALNADENALRAQIRKQRSVFIQRAHAATRLLIPCSRYHQCATDAFLPLNSGGFKEEGVFELGSLLKGFNKDLFSLRSDRTTACSNSICSSCLLIAGKLDHKGIPPTCEAETEKRKSSIHFYSVA